MGNISLRGLQMLQFKKTSTEAQYFFSDIILNSIGVGLPTLPEIKVKHYNYGIQRPGIYYHRVEGLSWVYTTDKKLYLLKTWKFKELFKERSYERLTSAEVKAFETLWKLLTPEQKEHFHYDKQWKEGQRTLYRVLGRKDTILKDKLYKTTFCTCPICVALKEKMSATPITIPYDFDANPDREKDIALSVIDTGGENQLKLKIYRKQNNFELRLKDKLLCRGSFEKVHKYFNKIIIHIEDNKE